jgi:iron complex outermembrane recepter protein
MASTFVLHRQGLVAAVALLACLTASAQVPNTTQTITISGRAAPVMTVAGFGDVPLARAPLSGSVITAEQIADAGLATPAGITRLDASFSDAYNAEGYWSSFTARGYVLDNRSNFRRDGLPINAETAIALGNKDRIELLHGVSGIQAGISAPGGLVNFVVKRPNGVASRSISVGWQAAGTVDVQLDWSDRFGADGAGRFRLSAGATAIDPAVNDAKGRRLLIALATEWRLGAGSRIEAEVELSRQAQPSVPGISLLGGRLPDAHEIDPRTNLNRQPWSQPVVLGGTTASLRWQAALAEGWRAQIHGAVQKLRSDDRVAFPFGCYDAGTDIYYADRYCPDGSFDLYDFRSDGERRNTAALDAQLRGSVVIGEMRHALTFGALRAHTSERFNAQAFNYAGQGQIDGASITLPAPELTTGATRRDERSTEIYARDLLQLRPGLQLWIGLRHMSLQRPTYRQTFTTPWAALSADLGSGYMAYASWGQGVESEAVPNRDRYSNRGALLPALKSRQIEVGLKFASNGIEGKLSAFDIRRPLAADIGACDLADSCLRRIDGQARHRGLEASASVRTGGWQWHAGAMLLEATRRGSSDDELNGLRPVNVPRRTFKLRVAHDIAAWPGLSLSSGLVHEGPRSVLPDNSVNLPSWTRIDLAARLNTSLAGRPATWRIGVDNATNTRAWRESPYQFNHAYLFPIAPRSLRAAVQFSL